MKDNLATDSGEYLCTNCLFFYFALNISSCTVMQYRTVVSQMIMQHTCSYYAVADVVIEGHCACFILEKCAGWNSHLTVCQVM